MLIDLNGKRALVCGSTQGIGHGCALQIARSGATVTLAARNEESLASVSRELPCENGQNHGFICADFDDPTALQAAVRTAIDKKGGFDILVNNTGGPPSGPIVDADADAFLTAIKRHVICNHLLTQALLPGMKQAGFGRIINIISTSVFLPIRGLGVSNTTRAAVANWARTMACELAPFGITVNNVLPGYTDTVRLGALRKKKAERDGITEKEVESGWLAVTPAGRLGKPEEIGAVVAFLASPAASYVTGVNLPVDGGRTAAG